MLPIVPTVFPTITTLMGKEQRKQDKSFLYHNDVLLCIKNKGTSNNIIATKEIMVKWYYLKLELEMS